VKYVYRDGVNVSHMLCPLYLYHLVSYRYIIEVADFDFGQANDMEYKTFRERLQESISNAVYRSEFPEPGGSWSPSRKYGQMN